MFNFRYILLSLLIFSFFLSEEIEIIVYSSPFTIDTVMPEIELHTPDHGDSYLHGELITVTWTSFDDNPGDSPITINLSTHLSHPYNEIQTNIQDTGTFNLPAPLFINSLFVSMRLDIADYYGNVAYSYSQGYFTVGDPDTGQYDFVSESIFIEENSSQFTIDTKPPDILWVYPNDASTFIPVISPPSASYSS